MKASHRHLLSRCSEIKFGVVDILPPVRMLQHRLDKKIVSLCGSLPRSMQTDAVLFFVDHFHVSIVPEFAFFSKYHAPSWSIIHWMTASGATTVPLGPGDMNHAITAHAMALLLHPLDDHLNDGQIPASHLAMLIRSQGWTIMKAAMTRLADGCKRCEHITEGLIDDYYSSIHDPEKTDSLDRYCHLFRKQMATWMIVPRLIAEKTKTGNTFSPDIQSALGSFGIAWRLLDDIRDIRIDRARGTHSAIYACLPGDMKKEWDRPPGVAGDDGLESDPSILDAICDNRIMDRLTDRIGKELAAAAAVAENYRMGGLAAELMGLYRNPCH